MARILIVEDEKDLQEVLAYNLRQAGHVPIVASDAREGLAALAAGPPDLVLLDLMLPDMPGTDVCRTIKSDPATRDIPVVMVTAKGEEIDRVVGFELGADDYVTKPFSMRELVSRVRAHLRRVGMAESLPAAERLIGGPVELDPESHEVRVRGEAMSFPPKEFELLEMFLAKKGRLLTRNFLIQSVWGSDYFGDTKTLDVHVKRLRQKIEEDPHHPKHVMTVRGLGYKFID
jgi:two-component system response regulator RegX3